MTDRASTYMFQPRLNQLIVYYEFERPEKYYSCDRTKLLKNFKEKEIYSGDISKGGQKKLRRAIETLYVITPTRKIFNRAIQKNTWFKLSHLTLTLPSYQGKWTDKEINTYCLRPFLLHCKRRFNLENYIWKAERQRNGNIHYHIISDMFFDYDSVRMIWNDKLNTLGYIDSFYKKHNHLQPPSIDLKYVRNSEQLSKYVSKYISKQKKETTTEQAHFNLYEMDQFYTGSILEGNLKEFENRRNGLISGRVWDCSEKLKSFKYQATTLSSSDEGIVNEIILSISKSRFDAEYFSVINFKDDTWLKEMPAALKNTFIAQYRDLLDQERIRFMEKRNSLNSN